MSTHSLNQEPHHPCQFWFSTTNVSSDPVLVDFNEKQIIFSQHIYALPLPKTEMSLPITAEQKRPISRRASKAS